MIQRWSCENAVTEVDITGAEGEMANTAVDITGGEGEMADARHARPLRIDGGFEFSWSIWSLSTAMFRL